MRMFRVVSMLLLLMITYSAKSFEINTHAFMSQKAYETSVLSPSHPNSILPILGLDRWPKAETFYLYQGLPALRGIRRYFDDVDVDESYLTATARPTTVMPFLEPLATQQTLLTFSFEANSPSTPFAQAMGKYLASRKFACGCATAPIRSDYRLRFPYGATNGGCRKAGRGCALLPSLLGARSF